MTAPDAVFGPPRTNGTHSCPDCRAGAGYPCTETCPRRVPDDGSSDDDASQR